MEALIYFLLIAALFAVMMRFGCGARTLGHHGKVGSGDQTRLTPPNADVPVPQPSSRKARR